MGGGIDILPKSGVIMRIKQMLCSVVIAALIGIFNCGASAAQVDIPRVNLMPNMPSPYQMRNWQQVARDYDAFVFDFTKTGQYLPLIWWDNTKINFNRTGFGMPSYVGRFGQTGANGHESINCMGAVISATLAGIDKSNQNGYNWVLMQENYFNSANGQNLYLNNIGGTTGGTFWYEVLPSVLFYQLNYLYPNTGDFNSEFITTADRWYDACVAMGGVISPWTLPNFYWTAFNFSTMSGVYNGSWRENDAAAVIGWVEYMAYIKTGDAKYLTAAKWCVEYLLAQTANPNYDMSLVYAPILATRLNKEQGYSYDVQKLINWCFDGNQNQWGVMVDTWNGLDVHGLMGAGNTNYIFEMETLQMAQAFTPVVRYDQRYARAIGKYLLHLANNSRLFYSNAHDANHQSSYAWASANDPNGCIGYEGIKKERIDYDHAAADYVTSYGQIISGSYVQTQVRDNVYEVLQEKVAVATDRLVHTWSIPMHDGYFHQVVIKAHVVDGGDADNGFEFLYATNPAGPWTSLFTFTSAADDFKWQQLPFGGAGTLYLQARDTNQETSQTKLDKLYVDEIWVETRNNNIIPYASGDPLSFGWGMTDLGLYGSSYVGVLGGIVKTTNVEKILQLDLLKTDYYRSSAYPTYLYYNPYGSAQIVDVNVGSSPVDIYDTVSQGMVKINVTGITQVSIPADSAQVLVLAPAGGQVTINGTKKSIDDVIVDYQTNTAFTNCPQIQASPQRLLADINGDCTVDIVDLEALSQSWLNLGQNLGRADIADNNAIDFNDFAVLGSQWLSLSSVSEIQLESFDNFVANGWVDGYTTGLMLQSVSPDRLYEGTGALRVKFEARTTQWDVAATRAFPSAMDMSGKSLSFWLWTDLVNNAILKQVIVWDSAGKYARYTVTKPSVAGWTKITAPLSAFVPEGASPNDTQIQTMQFWFSTWDTPGNSLYIDDLRLVPIL